MTNICLNILVFVTHHCKPLICAPWPRLKSTCNVSKYTSDYAVSKDVINIITDSLHAIH